MKHVIALLEERIKDNIGMIAEDTHVRWFEEWANEIDQCKEALIILKQTTMKYLLVRENFGFDTTTEFESHALAKNALDGIGKSAHILILTEDDNPVNYKILFNEVVYSIPKN